MFKLIPYFFIKLNIVIQRLPQYRFHFWEDTRSFSKSIFRNNESGFVLVLMCVVFVITFGLMIVFGSSLVLVRNKMETVHQCRTDLLNIQEGVKPLLESLFKLNPLAKTLRVQRAIVEAQLAAALASGNMAIVGALTARRHRIRFQQKILDKSQKTLIVLANTQLSKGSLQAYFNMQNKLRKVTLKQKDWTQAQWQVLPPKIPKLAVRPKDRRMAPEYEPKRDFERKQAVSLFWIHSVQINGWMHSEAFVEPRIKNECHVTLEENTWLVKIQRDRSL